MSTKWIFVMSLLLLTAAHMKAENEDITAKLVAALQPLVMKHETVNVEVNTVINSTKAAAVETASEDNSQTLVLNATTIKVINNFIYNNLNRSISLLGLELPVLDPYEELNFTLKTDPDPTFGSLDLEINDVEAVGLRSLTLTSLHLNLFESPMNLNLNVTLPEVRLNGGTYFLDCSIANIIPFVGEGSFWIQLDGTDLYVSLDLTSVDPFSVHFNGFDLSIDTFDSFFEHLMYNEEHGPVINDVMNVIMPKMLSGMAPMITDVLNDLLA